MRDVTVIKLDVDPDGALVTLDATMILVAVIFHIRRASRVHDYGKARSEQ